MAWQLACRAAGLDLCATPRQVRPLGSSSWGPHMLLAHLSTARAASSGVAYHSVLDFPVWYLTRPRHGFFLTRAESNSRLLYPCSTRPPRSSPASPSAIGPRLSKPQVTAYVSIFR